MYECIRKEKLLETYNMEVKNVDYAKLPKLTS